MDEIYIVKSNNNIIGIYSDFNLCINYIFSCVQLKFIQNNVIIYVYKNNSSIIIKKIRINEESLIINKLLYNYNQELSDDIVAPSIDINNVESYTNIKSYNNIDSHNNINSSFKNRSLSDIFKIDDNDFVLDPVTENDDKIDSDNESIYESYNNINDFESDSISVSSSYIKKEKEKQKEIAQEKINIIHNINLLKKEKEKLENDMNVYELDLKLYYKFKNLLSENNKFILPELFENKYNIFSQLEEKHQLSFENFVLLYNNESIQTDYDGIFNNTPNEYENKFINHDNSEIIKALEDNN